MYSNEYKYLGNHFDIHGGGMDLKFHITNVKLQKRSLYWTNSSQLLDACKHADMEKMAKSTNNILPREILTGKILFLSSFLSISSSIFFYHKHSTEVFLIF
jgi:cysteinyl-tRNA synthetase